jgi:hypothetical protein
MAAVGAVWTRPPALRLIGALIDATLELPRWWASQAVGLSARLGAAVVGRRVLRRSYLGPLMEKSRVLCGASVALHDVRPIAAVRSDLSLRDAARHFHVLEVTVRPRQNRPGVRRWSASDLVLVSPEALPACPEEDEEVGRVFRVERWHGGRFVDADGVALYGPQRLRLHVGLVPNARRFHFRYYLELLRRHYDAPL